MVTTTHVLNSMPCMKDSVISVPADHCHCWEVAKAHTVCLVFWGTQAKLFSTSPLSSV